MTSTNSAASAAGISLQYAWGGGRGRWVILHP